MKVGIVGLGNMGQLLAGAIVRAGIETYVYDVRTEPVQALEEQGAKGSASVAELAGLVDVVGVVVLNEAQVRDVVEQVAAAGHARTVVIHSTVTPAFVQSLAADPAFAKLAFVDAAVAGGIARAKTGDLTVMIGGSEETVQSVWPIFDAIGRELFHCGPAGAGSAVKLAVNFMTMSSYNLMLEATEFVRAYGIEEDDLMTVLTTSSADSKQVRAWGLQDRIRRNTPAGTTPAPLVFEKDLSSFATAAGEAGLVLPLAAVSASSTVRTIARRDAYIDALGDAYAPAPRCSVCTLELAAPFQEAGVHPECASH
ncbi:NAD(P)-dependent oxidoreductase [Streptomyces sp. NPDC050625]|uniref:NAD(P)-dependent oxidoreductase n=1 Tax=Streptomyces sp. NPDC050625 TaxID=3154629 RepID=UPI003416C1CA